MKPALEGPFAKVLGGGLPPSPPPARMLWSFNDILGQ